MITINICCFQTLHFLLNKLIKYVYEIFIPTHSILPAWHPGRARGPAVIARWWDSLANRGVVLFVGSILLTAALVTFFNAGASRPELEDQAREQVSTVADLLSRELDRKLIERFTVLTEAAAAMTMDRVSLEQFAPRLLERQAPLSHLFERLFLFSEAGRLAAAYPPDQEVLGIDVSQRPYFMDTGAQLTPQISEPFVSYLYRRPMVMMTAPVFDHVNRFAGIAGGSIVLNSNNFLSEVASVRVGNAGYVSVSSRAGTVLVHRDPARNMQPLEAPDAATLAALDGYEGTRVASLADGREALVAVRQLNMAPWFVTVTWPLDDAFAPADRLKDSLLLLSLGLMVVLVPLALFLFRHQMRPLNELAGQIRDSHLGVRSRPVAVGGGREISEVSATFNQIMAERARVLDTLTEREAFFRTLSQSSPVGLVQTDVLGRVEFTNPAFENIIGSRQAPVIGTYLLALVASDDRSRVRTGWREALQRHTAFTTEVRLDHRITGQPAWVSVMTAPIETGASVIGTISVVRDITRERMVERQLRNEQQRAESILAVLQEGVLMTDVEGCIRYANEAVVSFLGRPVTVNETVLFDVVDIITEGETWAAADFLALDRIENLDAVMHDHQGETLDVEITMLRVNKGLADERLVFVLRDDSERRRQEQHLSWQATHDSLTGLQNRRGFNTTLLKCLGEAAEQATPGVLMIIDLDYFKPVNDGGGHLLGDDLLRRLAAIFRHTVRQSDTVARLGGDEFAILLPACGLERGLELAEQVRGAVEKLRIQQDGRDYGVTVSIGVTRLLGTDTGSKDAVARADEAAYGAKAQGRNRVVVI